MCRADVFYKFKYTGLVESKIASPCWSIYFHKWVGRRGWGGGDGMGLPGAGGCTYVHTYLLNTFPHEALQ